MDVTGLVGLLIITPAEGEDTAHWKANGEPEADAVKVFATDGGEQTEEGPLIGFMTGTWEKAGIESRMIRDKRSFT
jgi:hypothetical protein